MKTKHHLAALATRYDQICKDADGAISSDKIFALLKPKIEKFLRANADVAARQTFRQIENRVLDSTDSVVQSGQTELPLNLNLNAVVPLGDKTRILYRFCNRVQLETRRRIIRENKDHIVVRADQEIDAIDAALDKMGPGDRLQDIL